MTGCPGKCPSKNGSFAVTFFTPTMLLVDLEIDDLVDQEERIPVREDLLDRVDVEDDALLPLVLVLPDELLLLVELPDHPREFDVAGVSRARGEDLRLERHADQREVAHDVEQLVARRFVRESGAGGCSGRRCSRG